ncbi:hypothetical protein ELI35_36165 [Rhizobium ruizarguesonis]|nr:hypothetical protein ELI34_36710 [Rhizobium ruizarguesonis]TAV19591.1 hypothetical protein ELI35_36165 [Rhizobium ruizarguesonis]
MSTVSRRGLLQATHEAAAFAGCIHSHTGLTLREHPIAFLREDLAARSLVTCGEAMSARDGRWLMTGGLVLVRQMPGSAKGPPNIKGAQIYGMAFISGQPSADNSRSRFF